LTLVDVLVEEASEDVQKMSALAPMKESYFDTSFMRLLYERSRILIALLLAGSFTTTIMRAYESTLEIGFLLYFASMLTSTGGNTSSQTSAMVIQGLALGDIQPANMLRFLRREFLMACMIGTILGVTAFMRVYVTTGEPLQSFAVSLALAVIVIVSVVFGSCIPLVLRRFNIDPAFSAGPFLATLMDILGALIYCYVARLILS
jgi:magnesium transporter